MFKNIKSLISRLLTPQFMRFILVALLNTAVGWCIFAALRYMLGLTPLRDPLFFANLFGTIISVLFNFKTYGILVFRNKSNRLIFKFVAVYTFTFFCNYLSIRCLKSVYNVNNYLGAAVMAVPIGFLNYFLNKIFVYKKKSD